MVVTAGAWAGPLLPSLDRLLAPERQVLGWFQPLRPDLFALDACPVVIGEFEEGHYYSLPVFGIPGYKIGKFRHLNEATTADGLDRDVRDEDEAVLRQALARYFPDANGTDDSAEALHVHEHARRPLHHRRLCPAHPTSFVAAGFSGHGFKFCSVVGEIMADLATRGETPPRHLLPPPRFDLRASHLQTVTTWRASERGRGDVRNSRCPQEWEGKTTV